MKIQSAEIKVLVHATEDFDKVLSCLSNIIPFEFEYSYQKTTGHFKNPIGIISVRIQRKKDIERFIERLNKNLSAKDKKEIIDSLEERFDKKGRLYIRLDKMRAYKGEVTLGEGLQITVTLTSYPFDSRKIISKLKEGGLFS